MKLFLFFGGFVCAQLFTTFHYFASEIDNCV